VSSPKTGLDRDQDEEGEAKQE